MVFHRLHKPKCHPPWTDFASKFQQLNEDARSAHIQDLCGHSFQVLRVNTKGQYERNTWPSFCKDKTPASKRTVPTPSCHPWGPWLVHITASIWRPQWSGWAVLMGLWWYLIPYIWTSLGMWQELLFYCLLTICRSSTEALASLSWCLWPTLQEGCLIVEP